MCVHENQDDEQQAKPKKSSAHSEIGEHKRDTVGAHPHAEQICCNAFRVLQDHSFSDAAPWL